MKVYEMQGLQFTLKPTTPKNRRAFCAYERDYIEELRDPENQAKSVDEVYERMERNVFERFKLATEGPHDEIVFDDFDVNLAEEAIQDFLPHYMKMMRQAIESLP